jgi:hypothetical protein
MPEPAMILQTIINNTQNANIETGEQSMIKSDHAAIQNGPQNINATAPEESKFVFL